MQGLVVVCVIDDDHAEHFAAGSEWNDGVIGEAEFFDEFMRKPIARFGGRHDHTLEVAVNLG